MRAPTVIRWSDGRLVATGSGGSNRIRTALLQLLVNLVDFEMDAEKAVKAPRMHLENGLLSVEGGFEPSTVEVLCEAYNDHQIWNELNMFFGGSHTVSLDSKGFSGAGDPRRGGVCCTVPRT